MQAVKRRCEKHILMTLLVTVLGCSKGTNSIIPGRDVRRLSASESGIDVSIFSDTNRVLYGRELCGFTNGDRIPLSLETRLEIKNMLENAKFARLNQSWKFPAEATVDTDDVKPEHAFLFFEGGFIQIGQKQYYVGISWAPIVQNVSNEYTTHFRNLRPANQSGQEQRRNGRTTLNN